MVLHIANFQKGRRTRRGVELPPAQQPPRERVVCVSPDVIREFLHCRNATELKAHLNRLKAEGRLIHEPGRLQNRVRMADGSKRRMHVIRAGANGSVPKYRMSPARQRVFEW